MNAVLAQPADTSPRADSVRRSRLIITIDGPAGTGKSSVGKALAELLDLVFLDTGAMYRAAAAVGIDQGIVRFTTDRDRPVQFDPVALVDAVVRADIRFNWAASPPEVLAFELPLKKRIRDKDVTAAVSHVAAVSALRRYMLQSQRQIALAHPRLLTEGRDQGTAVFPDAEVKFYLDATPDERARRRADQLKADGRPVDLPSIIEEIRLRDHIDSSRLDDPLKKPEDAIPVNTSNMPFDEVVRTLAEHVKSRMALRP